MAPDSAADDALKPVDDAPLFPELSAVWRVRMRRAFQVLAAAFLALTVVLAYRHRADHGELSASAAGRSLMLIALAALATVFWGSLLLVRPESGVRGRLWAAVASFSVLGVVGLGCIWYLVQTTVYETPVIGALMANQADVGAYLHRELPLDPTAPGGPWLIPTGVFVQSLQFSTANNVQVSGYVWHKYADTIPADITRGFVLPEAVAEAYRATEAYRFHENGAEVIGWYFSATLRQSFDYGRYPFDRQDVWLRIWHPDFNKNVFLTPDFSAYPDPSPVARPGMESDFVYEGWDPQFTAFSYGIIHYPTNFGLSALDERGQWPELFFNVGLKRDVLSPLVGHFLPLAVTAILLFAALTMTTRDSETSKLVGYGAVSITGYCAALFFVVSLDHNRLRGALATQKIVYLESFHFILYGAILLVSVNAILLARATKVKLIDYDNNIIPTLLYWPLVIGALLTATLIAFYR